MNDSCLIFIFNLHSLFILIDRFLVAEGKQANFVFTLDYSRTRQRVRKQRYKSDIQTEKKNKL